MFAGGPPPSVNALPTQGDAPEDYLSERKPLPDDERGDYRAEPTKLLGGSIRSNASRERVTEVPERCVP